jgi:hypothetical protein
MLDEVLIVHADAVVADREAMLDLIKIQIDAGVEGEGLVGVLGQVEVFQLVEGVRGVRYQLPKEDLRMGIKRVNDQVQELVDFGLEFSFRH